MTSNKKRVRLSDIIGPAFYETHKLIDMGVIDEAVESGGRASLKSSYVGTEVVLQLVKHPDCHALVTRQVGDTMRDSVYAQILWAIDKLGLTTKFKCTQSPLQCTYLPTGQRILFRGLDDPQKIKSIKLPFGYIGILWFEEADQIKGGEDPDPWAFNRCHYDAARKTLYIFDELTRLRTSNEETAKLVQQRIESWESVTADSAEMKSCADYRAFGILCREAVKGPGSVNQSMKWLQGLTAIVIDPHRCPDTAKEFSEYEYEVGRDGTVLPGYVDADNHHIDAVRYAVNRIWMRRGA